MIWLSDTTEGSQQDQKTDGEGVTQEAKHEEAKEQKPEKFGTGVNLQLWLDGKILSIMLVSTSVTLPELQSKLTEVGQQRDIQWRLQESVDSYLLTSTTLVSLLGLGSCPPQLYGVVLCIYCFPMAYCSRDSCMSALIF